MKIKIATYLLTFLLFCSIISAQITITQSDFTSIFTIGNTFMSFADTLTQSVNIGNVGSGNNWDFSGYVANQSFEIDYISPVGTPYENMFPSSNVVGYSEFTINDQGTTGIGRSWSYFNNNDASNEGLAIITVSTDGNTTDSTNSITKHIPPFVQYDFPIEANKVWSKKDSSETTISSSQGAFLSTTTTTYNISVDAWGTMILPGGKSFEALRMREQSITTSYFAGIPFSTSTSVTYSFVSKSGESFSISADNEDPPSSGTISGLIAWNSDAVTGIEKLDDVPIDFALNQNYPNPFNPTTTIQYSIASESFVKLKVYNLLGKEVTTLVNGLQTAGIYRYSFNGSNLSSGIYFVSLQADGFYQIRKMTLLK